MRFTFPAVTGGFALGTIGFVVTCGFWWQAWTKSVSTTPNPQIAMAMQMLDQMKAPENASPEEQKVYEDHRRSLQGLITESESARATDFPAWLRHRSSAVSARLLIGQLIWVLELALSGLAAAWICQGVSSLPFCETCLRWRKLIRSHTFKHPVPAGLKQIAGLPEDSVASVSVQFSQCSCGQRPKVSLVTNDGSAGARKIDKDNASDSEFATIKALMDEAEGMG